VSRVSAEEARGLLKALNAAEVPYGDGWKFTEAGFIHTRGNVAIGECWSQPVAALAAAAPTLARTVIALTEERDALAQRVASLDRAMADANESRKWDMVAAQSRQTAQENAERARAAAEVRADRLAAERDQLAAELADANDELARCSLATYGHDADSHCLSESIAEVVRERDEARAALEALPKWGDYGWRDAAASVAAKLREDASQIVALMSERDEARRERDRLRLMYATLRQTLVGTDERPWGVTIETTFKGSSGRLAALIRSRIDKAIESADRAAAEVDRG
jgi:hypothetical protein